MPGLAERVWRGLAKDMGRQFRPPVRAGSQPEDEQHQAATRSCAALFTKDNKAGVQLLIQLAKFASGEDAFVNMIQTLALFNKNNPQHVFKLTEATHGDLHYSCAADYFGQLLPAADRLEVLGMEAYGVAGWQAALDLLLQIYQERTEPAPKEDEKKLEAGIKVIGDDCLGLALDELTASQAA